MSTISTLHTLAISGDSHAFFAFLYKQDRKHAYDLLDHFQQHKPKACATTRTSKERRRIAEGLLVSVIAEWGVLPDRKWFEHLLQCADFPPNAAHNITRFTVGKNYIPDVPAVTREYLYYIINRMQDQEYIPYANLPDEKGVIRKSKTGPRSGHSNPIPAAPESLSWIGLAAEEPRESTPG